MTFYQIIGLFGAGLYLTSYALLQYRRNFARSVTYSLMNLAAAACMIISLSGDWNLAAYIIQLAWLVISAYGLYKCFFIPRSGTEDKTLADHSKDR
jgi:hypothetical protein